MITKIQNSRFFKGLVLTLLFAFLNLSLQATPVKNEVLLTGNPILEEVSSFPTNDVFVGDKKVLLRAGTPITVETTNRLSSRNLNVGQTIDLRVKYDVMSDNILLIPAGSLAYGKISNIQKRKVFGKGGKIEVQIENVMAIDGQTIPISGIPMIAEGDNRLGLAITIAIVGGIFYLLPGLCSLLVKGKEAEMAASTSMSGNVAANREIEVVNNP